MRIIYVHRREWPAKSPGAAFSTFNAHALASEGVDMHLIVGRGSTTAPNEVLADYYSLTPLEHLNIYPLKRHRKFSLGFYLAALRQAWRLIRQQNVDAVISRDPGFIPYLAFIKRWLGVKVYAEAHNFFLEITEDIQHPRRLKQQRKYHRIEKKYLPQLSGVICLLSPQAELYRKYLPQDRVHVANPGVRATALPKTPLLDREWIGYIGGVQPQRDLETVFKAFSMLKSLNQKLLIVGGHPQEIQGLEAMIQKYQLEDLVKITGWISYTEMLQYLAELRIGLVPMKDNFYNRHLTAPMKILDYLSRGIPVLAADLPSSREFVDDSEGLFYTPGDAQQLADRIRQLHEQPTRLQELSQGALQKGQLLTWQNRAKRIIQIIQQSSPIH